MPINRGAHLSAIIEEILCIKPQSILDVGMGWGMMGSIFQVFTDVRCGRLQKEDWGLKLDGIEIFEPYRNLAWDFYDTIYVGDALTEIAGLDKYDVVYCGDMIEHLTKEDGHKLIEKMLSHCNAWVIIATPSPARPQEGVYGNKSETHLSDWTEEDFKKYNYEMISTIGWGTDYMLCIRLKP
jgi:hypothetical protein